MVNESGLRSCIKVREVGVAGVREGGSGYCRRGIDRRWRLLEGPPGVRFVMWGAEVVMTCGDIAKCCGRRAGRLMLYFWFLVGGGGRLWVRDSK